MEEALGFAGKNGGSMVVEKDRRFFGLVEGIGAGACAGEVGGVV